MHPQPPVVSFHLLGDLAALTRPAGPPTTAPLPFRRRPLREPAAVKDPLEALGVPHTEVDLLLLDGRPIGLDHRVRGGEAIEVHPPPAARPGDLDPDLIDLAWPAHRLLPRPLARRRLACDQHLGKLARLLRLTGFDVLWRADWREPELAAAAAEDRAVLTCSRSLMKRNEITCGRLVRSRHPDEQAREAIRRFGLPPRSEWLARCSVCNGPTRPVGLEEVAGRVPPRTRLWRRDYRICDRCGQVYWEGTHVERLQRRLEAILAGL